MKQNLVTDSVFSIGIYGLGKAGSSFYLTTLNHKISVSAVCSRSHPCYFDPKLFFAELKKHNTQILILAVSDDALEVVINQISKMDWLPPYIAHLSGAFSHEILQPLFKRSGTAQFHLLCSMNGKNPISPETLNAICASDEKTKNLFWQLSKQMEFKPFDLALEMQPLYHAAACIAGNLPIALIDEAMKLLKSTGLDDVTLRTSLSNLLHSTANAIEKKPLAEALTGPIARGDVKTIKRHLDALKNLPSNNDIEKIYRLLSLKLLQLDNMKEQSALLKLLS